MIWWLLQFEPHLERRFPKVIWTQAVPPTSFELQLSLKYDFSMSRKTRDILLVASLTGAITRILAAVSFLFLLILLRRSGHWQALCCQKSNSHYMLSRSYCIQRPCRLRSRHFCFIPPLPRGQVPLKALSRARPPYLDTAISLVISLPFSTVSIYINLAWLHT